MRKLCRGAGGCGAQGGNRAGPAPGRLMAAGKLGAVRVDLASTGPPRGNGTIGGAGGSVDEGAHTLRGGAGRRPPPAAGRGGRDRARGARRGARAGTVIGRGRRHPRARPAGGRGRRGKAVAARTTTPPERGLCDGVGLTGGRPWYGERRQRTRIRRRGGRLRGGLGTGQVPGGPGPWTVVRERDGGETIVNRRLSVSGFPAPGWRGREEREALETAIRVVAQVHAGPGGGRKEYLLPRIGPTSVGVRGAAGGDEDCLDGEGYRLPHHSLVAGVFRHAR